MDIFWEILFGTKGKPRNISSDQKIFQTHWRWKIFWLSFSPEEIFLGRLVSVHVSISIIWLEIETQRRDGWATVTWNCWKYFGNHNSCSDYLSNNSIHSISPRKNSIFSCSSGKSNELSYSGSEFTSDVSRGLKGMKFNRKRLFLQIFFCSFRPDVWCELKEFIFFNGWIPRRINPAVNSVLCPLLSKNMNSLAKRKLSPFDTPITVDSLADTIRNISLAVVIGMSKDEEISRPFGSSRLWHLWLRCSI